MPSHSNYYCILPADKSICPKVAIYARKLFRFQAQVRSDICSDSGLLVVNVIDVKNQFETFQLINIYNGKSLKDDCNAWTVKRSLKHIISSSHTVNCEDFNAHHSKWNSTHKSERAEAFINLLNTHDFVFLNDSKQTGTFNRHGLKQKSVLDLTFFTSSLEKKPHN